MARIIAIVGLPGSGKTFYAKTLAKQLNALVIDDPKEWLKTEEFLRSHFGKTVIITDPFLCLEKNRDVASTLFSNLEYKLEWIFFANDPEQCKKNALSRGDRSATDIDWFSKNYKIPNSISPKPVWTP